MELSKYISSEKAVELGIDNKPVPQIEERCKFFLYAMVEPLEILFHPKQIVFHSGYRCNALNEAVKGKTFSDHKRGQAIDFTVQGYSLEDAFRIIDNSSLIFKQLILEGKEGHQWLHLSYDLDVAASKQKREVLRIPNP